MATPVPIPPNLAFPNTFGLFTFFCQKVLPAVYDDSLSYYEVVCKIAKQLNDALEAVNDLNEDTQQIYDYVKQLQEVLDQFMESGFDDYYKEQVAGWIAENLKWIFDHLIRNVFFGLTKDGYFTAYIPDSWDDIVFDTGAVYGTKEYGRLILLYNVNGVNWDDSTGNGNLPYLSELESRVKNLERNVGINNRTLYTELSPDGRISLPPTGKRIDNPLK